MGKRKKHKSFLVMTMAACREAGFIVEKTEHWNPYAHVRHDLFGFIDAIAMGKKGKIALQSTDISGRWPHINAIMANPNAKEWCQNGDKIAVWSWRLLVTGKYKNGRNKLTWTPQIDYITLENFK